MSFSAMSTMTTLRALAGSATLFFAGFLAAALLAAPGADVSPAVMVWWAGLSAISVFNLGVWLFIPTDPDPAMRAYRRKQRWLALVYVLVCGFRSFLPRADVQRICLVDSWFSTVLVGRSAATIAEICFMLQWSIFLHELGKATQSRLAQRIAAVMIPMILIAETCSWYAVVTTNFLGNVCEESLWGLFGALAVVAGAVMWPRLTGVYRWIMPLPLALGVGYVIFMATVDVPMYWTRWLADQAAGREYLSFAAGFDDLNTRWVVTHAWAEWRHELAWMGLYFSLAVWGSLALQHAPSPRGVVGAAKAEA